MKEEILLSGSPNGSDLRIRTPGRFCMDVAIEVLNHLEEQPQYFPKNTGWKEGFGLEVSAWIPITYGSSRAELMTDGDESILRRVSGPYGEFEALFNDVCKFIHESIA